MHPAGVTELRRVVLLSGLLALGLTACGSGGGGPDSSARPSAALPTRSAPAPTGSAAPEPSASQSPRPSLARPHPVHRRSPGAQPHADDEADPDTPSHAVRGGVASAGPRRRRSRADLRLAAGPDADADSGADPDAHLQLDRGRGPRSIARLVLVHVWWWLLGLLIALGLGALLLALRLRRARHAWEAQLGSAVAESRWLAHELVPTVLSTGNPAARRGIWMASRPRVEALENGLRPVVASAPKDRSVSVDRLQVAVTDLRYAMDAYAATAHRTTGRASVRPGRLSDSSRKLSARSSHARPSPAAGGHVQACRVSTGAPGVAVGPANSRWRRRLGVTTGRMTGWSSPCWTPRDPMTVGRRNEDRKAANHSYTAGGRPGSAACTVPSGSDRG